MASKVMSPVRTFAPRHHSWFRQRQRRWSRQPAMKPTGQNFASIRDQSRRNHCPTMLPNRRRFPKRKLPRRRSWTSAPSRGLSRRQIVMKAIQVFYEGRVQGVGFRYSVRQIAKGFNVTGWVRNLANGRVELQVSGEAEEVNAFLEAIRQSDLGSLIKKESEHMLATPPDSRGFEIRT